MSLPETCPFCGTSPYVMADGKPCRGGDSWVLFSCDTALHAGQDMRRTQSRKCEGFERTRLLARIAALEAQNKDLRDRFAEVDTVKNAALNCVKEATCAVLRLSPLEAEAKQAREDEAWAHLHAVPIHRRGEVWVAEHFDGSQVRDAEAPTIAASLRALRAKVEGGAR